MQMNGIMKNKKSKHNHCVHLNESGDAKRQGVCIFNFIIGGLGFGFALLAVVLVIVAAIKGRHYLSGQVVPLQEIHEMFSPGLKNSIEMTENEQS